MLTDDIVTRLRTIAEAPSRSAIEALAAELEETIVPFEIMAHRKAYEDWFRGECTYLSGDDDRDSIHPDAGSALRELKKLFFFNRTKVGGECEDDEYGRATYHPYEITLFVRGRRVGNDHPLVMTARERIEVVAARATRMRAAITEIRARRKAEEERARTHEREKELLARLLAKYGPIA